MYNPSNLIDPSICILVLIVSTGYIPKMLVARAHAAAARWDRAADIVLKKVVSGLELLVVVRP